MRFPPLRRNFRLYNDDNGSSADDSTNNNSNTNPNSNHYIDLSATGRYADADTNCCQKPNNYGDEHDDIGSASNDNNLDSLPDASAIPNRKLKLKHRP
jgi:hypothetical protein